MIEAARMLFFADLYTFCVNVALAFSLNQDTQSDVDNIMNKWQCNAVVVEDEEDGWRRSLT